MTKHTEFVRIGRTWVGPDGVAFPVVGGGDGSTEFTTGVVEGDPHAVTAGFVIDAGDGVITGTGVQPGARPAPVTRTPEFQTGAVQQTAAPTTSTTTPPQTFTSEDIEKARKEEKDKLYADLQEAKKRAKEAEDREKQRQKAEDDARAAAEADAQKRKEEEMDVRALLEERTQQFNQQLEQERRERETIAATLEMERRYAAISSYRSERVNQERENILPELIDLITGNTEDEIETSIASLRQRTEAILGNVQAAAAQARQSMTGTNVTAPPVGPLETQANQQTITPEDIRNMDIATYAQNRDRLLGATRQLTKERGIYG